MTQWTTFIIKRPRCVLATWLVLLAAGGWAAAHLADQLSTRFSVPGADSERGLALLEAQMGARSDGAFTLVATGVDSATDRAAVLAAARRAARAVRGGTVGRVLQAAPGITAVQLSTPLDSHAASLQTTHLRRAIGDVAGVRTYLSGYPAIDHDSQRIYNADLRRGEVIAVPVALAVLALIFGSLGAVVVPVAFAAATIPTTLGIVWLLAHVTDMATYVTNIVVLIGLAIAVDYSMLVVSRYRQELRRTADPQAALLATMATAGRTTLFSGATVAIGLALLVLVPVPFMRSMGIGGLVVPLVSIAAAATLLPALLAVIGPRVDRLPLVSRAALARRAASDVTGAWHRLARSIMRRPLLWCIAAAAVMGALALPALGVELTVGDNRGTAATTEATYGQRILERSLGPGALAPHQLVVDAQRPGGAGEAGVRVAARRVIAALQADPEIAPGAAPAAVADREGRILEIRAAGRSDPGSQAAIDLVHRIRDQHVPAAGFPPDTDVLLTGTAAYGVDFIDKSYTALPWLVLGVLAISYVLLLRAFRSVVLPAKAVLMNLLSVGATLGVLVLVFQHGWGSPLGLEQTPQIEAWIPIFLFALLFGLSMDYEVFLLARVREEWDKSADNQHAVAVGLEQTGRIITAAAIIMIAAFSGLVAGSFVGLQQFGVGLAAAIFLDATVVRAVLVPATMRLLGRWNWYVPERHFRLVTGPWYRKQPQEPS